MLSEKRNIALINIKDSLCTRVFVKSHFQEISVKLGWILFNTLDSPQKTVVAERKRSVTECNIRQINPHRAPNSDSFIRRVLTNEERENGCKE